MTSINFTEIFESFLGNITDYSFIELTPCDSYSLMGEYLQKAVANSYVRHLFSSISLDVDNQTLDYEMNYVLDEESDRRFVIMILAKQMVYEWIHPQVRSTNLTYQFFGGKEQKMYSQSAHLDQLRALEEDTKLEVHRLIKERNYINNSYLNGGMT